MISGFDRVVIPLIFLGLHFEFVGAHEVEGLRLWPGPESTRVVVDLSSPTSHRIFKLDNPFRVVIDLTDMTFPQGADLPEGRGLVASVRTGAQPRGLLRVVLDVNQPVEPQSFLLEPNDIYGHRLVIDLSPAGRAPTVKRAPVVDRGSRRPVVIAIDAGHGGDDPGATGSRGVREKDVVLGIARKLAEEVELQDGMRSVLTRDGDYYLPLRERMDRAREAQADLFVSIHADAYRNASAKGATVYVLSDRGAADEAALAAVERLSRASSAAALGFAGPGFDGAGGAGD